MRLFRPLPVVALLALSACSPEPSNVANTPAQPNAEAVAATNAQDFPVLLQVAGTEPFWGVQVDGDVLMYTTPETMDSPRRLQAPRRVDGAGLHFSGGAQGEAFALDIRRMACSDGMSDYTYPYSAEFVLAGKPLKGCARDPAVPMPAQ